MKKIRVLVADDEPLARDGLATMVEKDPELELVAKCADGASTIAAIRQHRPDVALLDVQMPKRDGFGVLAELKANERPLIIFATAFDQHAIRAFEFAAIDYLLKPFSDARFAAALQRAKTEVRKAQTAGLDERVEQLLVYLREFAGADPVTPVAPQSLPPALPTGAPAPEYADRIILKAGTDLHFIKTRDVIWIEAQGDFVKVHLAGQAQLVRETLRAIEQKLDASKFVRIHRSFVVNLEHVRKVTPALYGDYAVLMSDGGKLRLSRNYRSKFKGLIAATAGA
jgi:two-component system LytT family response regulator